MLTLEIQINGTAAAHMHFKAGEWFPPVHELANLPEGTLTGYNIFPFDRVTIDQPELFSKPPKGWMPVGCPIRYTEEKYATMKHRNWGFMVKQILDLCQLRIVRTHITGLERVDTLETVTLILWGIKGEVKESIETFTITPALTQEARWGIK